MNDKRINQYLLSTYMTETPTETPTEIHRLIHTASHTHTQY
jgi:hypothetical protein